MRVTVSNIAWEPPEDDAVALVLTGLGVRGVEVAPTTRWSDPSAATRQEADAYRSQWSERGLEISSLQALLYGQPDLTVFANEDARERTLDWLAKISRLAGWLGAGPLVFGSPKNRRVEDLAENEVRRIAIDFFARAAEDARRAGATICLEANPPEYGADFATSTREVLDWVRAVDHPGFGVHLDLGGMQISKEPIEQRIRECGPLLRHVHVSEPFLAPVGASVLDHASIASALRDVDYEGWVSIEMRKDASGDHVGAVRDAAAKVVEAYGDR